MLFKNLFHNKPSEKSYQALQQQMAHEILLNRQPFCVLCLYDCKFVMASVVDYLDASNAQNLCDSCYRKKIMHEREMRNKT
jgi:hypothetical protein